MTFNGLHGKPLDSRGFFFLVLLSGLLLASLSASAQLRAKAVTASYSIKEVKPDGQQQLSMGSIRYDAESFILNYDNHFPSHYQIVINDTAVHFFKDGELQRSEASTEMARFSVFHLVLNAQLATFGLRDSPFEMTESESDDGMILSRWEPKLPMKGPLSAYEIALKDDKLYGIISRGKKDEVLGKQFFSDYINVNGHLFPTTCEEVRYLKEGEHTKVTTYSNIKLL